MTQEARSAAQGLRARPATKRFVCPRGHRHYEGAAFCAVCGAGPVREGGAAARGRRMRWRVSAWLLNHPSRLSWIAVELLRPWNGRKLRNAWWQLRHYDDAEAFSALYETHRRSYDPEA